MITSISRFPTLRIEGERQDAWNRMAERPVDVASEMMKKGAGEMLHL